MKKILALLLALAMVLALAACGSSPSAAPSTPPAAEPSTEPSAEPSAEPEAVAMTRPTSPTMVSIAGGSSSGTMFLLANAMALSLNNLAPDVFNATAESTTGTPAILELLENSEADFGWAANNTARDAYLGINTYEGNQFSNLASVAYGYEQVVQIVVRNDDSIQSVADLKGKSFGVSNAGSTTELNARLILGKYGLDYLDRDDVSEQYVGESQANDLISNNQLDGVLANAALGSSGMITLMTSGNCKLLSIDEKIIDEICTENPSFIPYTIPAGTYENQPEDVKTVAVVNYILCRADLPDELAYWFLDCIYQDNENLVLTHKAGATILPENAGIGMVIPMHPGALAWYTEHGYQIPEI